MIRELVSADGVLYSLTSATFSSGFTPDEQERLIAARTVLLAMTDSEQQRIAGMCACLMNNVRSRGMGPVTAFEVLVALGRLMERA